MHWPLSKNIIDLDLFRLCRGRKPVTARNAKGDIVLFPIHKCRPASAHEPWVGIDYGRDMTSIPVPPMTRTQFKRGDKVVIAKNGELVEGVIFGFGCDPNTKQIVTVHVWNNYQMLARSPDQVRLAEKRA